MSVSGGTTWAHWGGGETHQSQKHYNKTQKQNTHKHTQKIQPTQNDLYQQLLLSGGGVFVEGLFFFVAVVCRGALFLVVSSSCSVFSDSFLSPAISLSVVSRRVTLPPPSGRRRARSGGGGDGGGCERTLVPHEKHNENPQLKTKQHVPRRRLAPGGGSRRCCFCAARVCVLFSVLQAVRSFEGPNHEIAVRRALKPKQRKRHTTTTCFNQQTQPATPKKPTVTPKPTQLRSG